MQDIAHNTVTSPTVEQAIDLMQSLSPTEQKSALDYIRYLANQYGSSQSKYKSVVENETQPSFETIESDAETFTDNESLNKLDAGKFSDIFGIIKTDKRVTLEEMDETVRQRGAGL